jgi:NAD(P)-dependent dehydrogenase (short-subunit alcohol dehydrogenase family)
MASPGLPVPSGESVAKTTVVMHSSRCIAETATNADLDAARAVLETNLFGVWPLIQAVLALLRRSSAPRIVIVGSGAGSHGDRDF